MITDVVTSEHKLKWEHFSCCDKYYSITVCEFQIRLIEALVFLWQIQTNNKLTANITTIQDNLLRYSSNIPLTNNLDIILYDVKEFLD